jgi:hypothetical protein
MSGLRDHHLPPGIRCLLCLTGTPGPFSGLRRTIFCDGPRHGALRRLPTPATPAPPRRIAMRGSRCGTAVIIAWLERAWKNGVSGLYSINNAAKLLEGFTPHQARPAFAYGSCGLAILSHKGRGRPAAPPRVKRRPKARHSTSPLVGEGELANEGRVSMANPWPKLVRGFLKSNAKGGPCGPPSMRSMMALLTCSPRP